MLPAIKNNNPGNIEVSSSNWQGSTGTDGVYVIFKSPIWGFRALYKDIYNKIDVDGLDTLQQIFKKYLDVPFSHTIQDANNYAAYVANYLPGFGINDVITPDEKTLKAIAHGIAHYESGNDANVFSESDYNNGYLLFKGEEIITNPINIGIVLIVGVGAFFLLRKKRKK
jgi:hypothetical protein